MPDQNEKCFACGRRLHASRPATARAGDGQTVLVGITCATKITEAGAAGYEPPRGGPRLYDTFLVERA